MIDNTEVSMPTLTVDHQVFDVPADTRLVLALEDAGIAIGHRCGGFARCTTCRVTFVHGEPTTMTRAEFTKLRERKLYGTYRLSCQIVCEHDMQVQPIMTLENQDWTDTGPRPELTVTPEAVWYPVDELERGQTAGA
jgi:ferredoxin